MAIDDNASYELTGYQVKDLAQKIRVKADSASLGAVAFSNLYADLTGTPTIPTVYNGTLTIQQNGTTLGTFSANQSTDTTINLTGGATYTAGIGINQNDLTLNTISVDTVTVAMRSDLPRDFTGATSSVAGSEGLVPAPLAGDQDKVLKGDGTWGTAEASLVEMSYGESNAWAKFIAAYNAGSIVYCRASSNANPATGSQTRKAFMAYVNNATNPTSVEFQYVRSVSSKTDSQQCDQVFVYTLTNASGGTWSVVSRNMAPKINVSGPITKTFSTGANATVTIGADTMTGATSSAAGAAGVVPAPAAGDDGKFLSGDGTWKPMFCTVKTLSSTQSITSNSQTYLTGLEWTADADGTYLVIANGNIQAYNATDSYPRAGIYVDGVRDCYAAVHLSGSLQLSWSVIQAVTLTAGQVVRIGCANGVCMFFEGNRMIILRIA